MVVLCAVALAQNTIPFKEGSFEIVGTSGGEIQNMYIEESTVECFWSINNETRSIHCTTIETLMTEHPDNNKNISVESILIHDIDQNLLPDEAMEEYSTSITPYYTITISSENSGRKVNTTYCYIAQENGTFLEQNPNFSFGVKFTTKEAADQFLETLKSTLLD